LESRVKRQRDIQRRATRQARFEPMQREHRQRAQQREQQRGPMKCRLRSRAQSSISVDSVLQQVLHPEKLETAGARGPIKQENAAASR
jgi:hypothetical protein